jgi:DNA mismatch repair protein MutL
VEARRLFATLPARQKFLKRAATELGHVVEMLSRLALAAPRVGFVLEHDGRVVLDLPPVATGADRLHQVLGRDGARNLVEFAAEGSVLSIRGHLGRPDHSLSSARLVLTYVNGRFVRDRVLTRAILDGYESLLMRGRYPIAVVFLQVSAGEVDVNVHPTKAEVRFREPGRVHRLLAEQIRRSLRTALGADACEGRGADVPLGGTGARAAGWVQAEGPPWAGASPRPGVYAAGQVGRLGQPGLPGEVGPIGRPGAWDNQGGVLAPRGVAEAPRGYGASESIEPERLGGHAGALASRRGRFGALRVLGQVLDGYLVCASGRGLVLIDQHAAHERVRFERLREQLDAGRVAVQQLLVPEPLALGVREIEALDGARDALVRMGFEGEPFGDSVYLLRAVPAALADADCARVLRDLAAELAEGGASRVVDDAVATLLARVACHSAVRMGRRLELAEAEALLEAMDRTDIVGYCPHGRPAFVEIDAAALERMFKR